MVPLSAAEIAALVGGRLEAGAREPSRPFGRVRDLRDAGPQDVAFFVTRPGMGGRGPGPAERAQLRDTGAGLLLLEEGEDAGGRACVRVAKPTLAATILARHFAGWPPRGEAPDEPPRGPVRVHASAVVEEGVTLGAACQIGPGCVVRAGARVGAGAVLSERVSVGEGAEIGERSWIGPGVAIYARVRIGARCTVQANAVLGAPGFGYAWDGRRHLHMPQLGGVEIGDEVEIGAGTCIDAGTFRPTRVGDGCILDNQVQLGHNVQVGRAAVLCGMVGIAGGARIGDGVVIGGQAGVAGHVEIGAGAVLGGSAVVSGDVEPGAVMLGNPATEQRVYRRIQARLRREARGASED